MIALDFMTTNGRLTAVYRLDIPDNIKDSCLLQHASPSDRGPLDMLLEPIELEIRVPANICDSNNNGLDILNYSG
jgi:hypothetical protein